VNVTDAMNSTKTYTTFTTRQEYLPLAPSDCATTNVQRTSITITWDADGSTDKTRVERNTGTNWSLGEGTLISNASGLTITDANLLADTTYYYQLWTWNETDGIYSTTFASLSETTQANTLPTVSSFSIVNGSANVSIDVNWSALISDDDSDTITWTMNCSDGQHVSGETEGSDVVYLILTELSYNTSYMIWVNLTDGFETVNRWYTFTTTIFADTTPPEISDVTLSSSDPLDVLIGWENISCSITDASLIATVTINITLPDNSFSNQSMNTIPGTENYYYNTSLQQTGNYTFIIRAVDSNGFETFSNEQNISLAPNWDVNEDGTCNVLDLTIISNYYGQTGFEGWIRADDDNNGEIQVLDFVIASNHYDEGWW